MIDPVSLVIGGALVAAGWFAGRVSRRRPHAPPSSSTVCSCSHGYGSHENGGLCGAEIERPFYWANGHRHGYEWVPCPCLSYDGPEPLPRVWTGPGELT
jgi:hypothetical protein